MKPFRRSMRQDAARHLRFHPAMKLGSYGFRCVAGIVGGLVWGAVASAQTPSPFTHWQNAPGIVLAPLAGPVPEWRVTAGFGVAVMPLYEGSSHYRMSPAPAFDIRYRDIAFVSSGDGLGVNVIRGDTYRAGVAIGYDVGRNAHLSGRLNGLGNVEAAPEARLFAEIAVLPFIFNFNLRRALGGHDGVIGDVGAYLPIIGTEELVVFVGPSVTFANRRYMQAYFGVSTAQAAGSRANFTPYSAAGGLKSIGVGADAIYHFTERWFVDADIALQRLADSAGNSPIVQDKNQLGVSVIVAYEF
jgi:outer membrane scaffolding protein for murein synthesis (MipA/OmpV family)